MIAVNTFIPEWFIQQENIYCCLHNRSKSEKWESCIFICCLVFPLQQ